MTFFCLNCLHSSITENKRKSRKKLCGNCNFVLPSEGTEILEFNQYRKYDKAPFILYADLECLIQKFDGYKNNPENLSTRKIYNIVIYDKHDVRK